VKAIVGKNPIEIAPRLLGFLSLARQTALQGDLLRGEAGELCVLPCQGEELGWSSDGPRHFVEVQLEGDRVEFESGAGFRVVERRRAQGALEIATAVSVASAPLPRWRQRVLLALRDAAVLGHVVRALLERGHRDLTFARVEPGAVHPGTEFVLLVRDAPLYVVMEVVEEGLGAAFYEASHAREPDRLLGLYLPWGRHFPLVAALGARLERPCVRTIAGPLVGLEVDKLTSIDVALSPEIDASVLPVHHATPDRVRVRVPLRLQALDKEQPAEPTELWRVGREILDGLASELACAEDRLAHLLAQVVRLADQDGLSVFIWSPVSPDQDGERMGFSNLPAFARARRRLPNLLLPSRHAILPTLADETLRSLFGLREGVLTVLDFTPSRDLIQYGLPLAHFQPLRKALVDYVLHVHEQPLVELCDPSRFSFAPIVLPPPEAGAPESPADSSLPAPPARAQAPVSAENEEALGGDEPITAMPAQAPPRATALPAPPKIDWPGRLEDTTQALIATPESLGIWLHFCEAASALGLAQDARMALLRFVLSCRPTQARSLLSAALDASGKPPEVNLLSVLSSEVAPVPTCDAAVQQVLALARLALDPPSGLSADERRGLARLPSRLRGLGAPRLPWTAAHLAWQLTRDWHLLEETRLWIEPALLAISVHAAFPPHIAHELEIRNTQANRAAVEAFAEGAALGPAELVFLRLAYALRVVVLGGGVDGAWFAELSAELESAHGALGPSAPLAQSALRTLEQARTHGLASLSGYAVSANLHTVLVEEGFLPPVNPTEETEIRQAGAVLASATEADAVQGVQALFERAARAPGQGLDALFAVVSRLRGAEQREALAALLARVNAARANHRGPGRTAVLLASLASGLTCALNPGSDPGPGLEELVSLAAGLPPWDQALAWRAVLSALEPLPVEARRARAAPLYQALRSQLGDWSGQRAIRVEEQRALFRLVNLLVVPVDDMPEGERLRRSEWTALRETIRRDLELARSKDASPALSPTVRKFP